VTVNAPSAPPATLPATVPALGPAPSNPLAIEYSKPIGSTVARPIAADRAATTSFDVDLHEPKKDDTYASISKDFYNDAKYATALQEYNGRRPLQTSVRVEVPPIHVLKKRYPQLVGAVVPVSGKSSDGWAPATDTGPAFRPSGQRTFTVPAGGLTMASIARDTLGSISRWRDIYDINPQLSPGDVLPAGTVVKIPTELKSN
jgi:nucleoid-associated protein YgaU